MKKWTCDICGREFHMPNPKEYDHSVECTTDITNVVYSCGMVCRDRRTLDVCDSCQAKIKLAREQAEMRIVNRGVWKKHGR